MSDPGRDTIYALSSGQPPAAIAVVRMSGPAADRALAALIGRLPPPRRASLARVCDAAGETLDTAIAIRFPGPASATGEDLVELHLHGGRSVVAAVTGALAAMAGVRGAQPGEFTRRAFENGRIDLAEAEGLADLLAAETQSQRRAAMNLVSGGLSRRVEAWRARLLALAARVEAALDFADEDDVADTLPEEWAQALAELLGEIDSLLLQPTVDRLRDGVRVAIAGPANAGKSSLFNVLVGRDAAITSPIAGTTRDLVEAPVAIGGLPFVLVDTAGLRATADPIEAIGVDRAHQSVAAADMILWLGAPEACPDPERSILVHPKADITTGATGTALRVSSVTGEGVPTLIAQLLERGRCLLPAEGELALNARHRAALRLCGDALREARATADLLVAAEGLRIARNALDSITGRAGVEEMLDALFGSFCIGK